MKLLDGKALSQTIFEELKSKLLQTVSKGNKVPHLVAILVGNDGASETYVASKVKSCQQIGVKSTMLRYPAECCEEMLLEKIQELNENKDIDGILVQLPLPKQINPEKVKEAILPEKDVDGFHPVNIGKMVKNLPCFLPATPYGILLLLEKYNIETSGKHCVVVGRSDIVGMPMSILLGRKNYPGNCTVTLCHSATVGLDDYIRSADILIAALGKPQFVKGEMIKEGAVVIDVGITRLPSVQTKSGFKLFGDVNFEEVAPKCSFITPVPGGVGPMTIAALLINTVKAAEYLK
ncbi:MAG: bifunctional 5,10-methylene-tetrahydrofolate dehydrogenase/5,10-methylene-tetrahydrofolate cyclohydrolase [Bacteroidetes bacterium RIFCSPLOWO2_02_FULL_36_8]|nr:MAG: bifunctional 5,10-methylene-tetrahydrofolate dehydrogenase/5,10-methylene-tetrahydrofolate cyclohydrolase [Bacteroidetes bacterium RIFCSPLOWO2_02_FULL_36_8]OFY71471.1 MAG: bifunctional 5,10-methylene-tetrahydrofolate dehydrogenase/5,10-methylene-tetrahydrofolate cyclohydrolase [Bacteroidetes bacterium RIFCSPLOWO2_12_FULL_37_12]